jgi:hypothetical protein
LCIIYNQNFIAFVAPYVLLLHAAPAGGSVLLAVQPGLVTSFPTPACLGFHGALSPLLRELHHTHIKVLSSLRQQQQQQQESTPGSSSAPQ